MGAEGSGEVVYPCPVPADTYEEVGCVWRLSSTAQATVLYTSQRLQVISLADF